MKKKSVYEMLPEYDFSNGIKGKFARAFAEGTNIIILAPDVMKDFPNSKSVNETLRAIAKIARRNRKKVVA